MTQETKEKSLKILFCCALQVSLLSVLWLPPWGLTLVRTSGSSVALATASPPGWLSLLPALL